MGGKCIVDTNVITKLLRSDKRSDELFEQADEILIPSIVVGELYYGAYNSTRVQENLEIFSDFFSLYEILDVDSNIAQTYGEIKAQLKKDGINIPENDLWIAAIAKFYQYDLVTFDRHFEKVDGIQVVS
jgi:tRNA(fMet)-specific endonuclease VapC